MVIIDESELTLSFSVPIGGLASAVILFTLKVPESARGKDLEVSLKEKILQMDLLGVVTIMGGILCYLLAVEWGGVTKAWDDGSVIGTLVASAVLLVLFGILEWRLGERALLPGRLIKQRIILIPSIFVIFLSGAFFYAGLLSPDIFSVGFWSFATGIGDQKFRHHCLSQHLYNSQRWNDYCLWPFRALDDRRFRTCHCRCRAHLHLEDR